MGEVGLGLEVDDFEDGLLLALGDGSGLVDDAY